MITEPRHKRNKPNSSHMFIKSALIIIVMTGGLSSVDRTACVLCINHALRQKPPFCDYPLKIAVGGFSNSIYNRPSFHSSNLKAGYYWTVSYSYKQYQYCTQNYPGWRADSSTGPKNMREKEIIFVNFVQSLT